MMMITYSCKHRNPVNEQHNPGCYPKTAGMKGSRKGKKIVMLCYFKSKPKKEYSVPIRRYRKRISQYGKRLDPLSQVY